MIYCTKLYFDCKRDNIKEITNVLRDPIYNDEIQEKHQLTIMIISKFKISGQRIHHTTARNADSKKFYYYLFCSFLIVVNSCNLIAMFVFLWFYW